MDKVKITAKITLEFEVLVDQDDYEAWEAVDGRGGPVAAELERAALEVIDDASPADLELCEAWLVEEDGYLGTEIVRLQKF